MSPVFTQTESIDALKEAPTLPRFITEGLPTVRIRWFRREAKLDTHKMLRNAIFQRGTFPEAPLQKRRVSGKHPENSEYRAQPRHNSCWHPLVRSRLPDSPQSVEHSRSVGIWN